MDPACGIHAHNLTLKNPVSQLFGEGGLNKRNALQLIHSAYNLQYGGGGGMELQEFEQLHSELFNKKWKVMTCPVMTRWYTVGLGAEQVLKEWNNLAIMTKKIRILTPLKAPQASVKHLFLIFVLMEIHNPVLFIRRYRK